MAVHQVLTAMVDHKQDVEDLVQAVATAGGWLPLLPAVPVDGDPGLAELREKQPALQH